MFDDVLKTTRLGLRPPVEGDVERLVELLNNWNVASKLAKAPYPYARADAEGFLTRAKQRQPTIDDAVYAIAMDGDLLGVISVAPQVRGPNLGYWLGEPYCGQGLMTEAVGAVVTEFFRQPENQVLASGIFSGNDPSLTVQKKFGFEVVGESLVRSVSRGEEVRNVDTRLTRQRYEEFTS